MLKNDTIKSRINYLIDKEGVTPYKISKETGISQSVLSRIRSNTSTQSSLQSETLQVLARYFRVSPKWLLTGEDDDIASPNAEPQFEILDEPNGKKGLIPFYGDIQSTGGDVSLRADVDVSQTIPSSWIDAGDFFREATAIIEHIGESMVEYPNKCMIAIKKVEDVTLLVNGDVYVIETSEYRVTKKVLDNNNEYITGYSTNPETYPDGQLIYAPMKIPKEKIRAIYSVLGYAYVRHGQKIVLRTKK